MTFVKSVNTATLKLHIYADFLYFVFNRLRIASNIPNFKVFGSEFGNNSTRLGVSVSPFPPKNN